MKVNNALVSTTEGTKRRTKENVLSAYLIAKRPASVQTLRKSAPLKLSDNLTQAS